MSINPARVEEIYASCLAEELPEDDPNYLITEGILRSTAMDKAKLDTHRDEVAEILGQLPMTYRPPKVGGGGGWSFLNACFDKNDEQWTGLHQTMDMLFQLGIGLGMASWLGGRELWEAFPGGMPYVSVTLPGDEA